jgi:ketosteroid isomerase-like protein
VKSALQAWAGAWSRRDMKAYVAAYLPDFRGSQASHPEWVRERTARIASRRQIDVQLSDITVTVTGDRAEASFRQDYSADGRQIRSRKQVEMHRVKGRWLIRQESGR